MPHFGIYSHFPPINSSATSLHWRKVRWTLFWMLSQWMDNFCLFSLVKHFWLLLHIGSPHIFCWRVFAQKLTSSFRNKLVLYIRGKRSAISPESLATPLQMTAILEETARCLIIGTKHLILTTLGLYVVWHVGPCIVFVMSRETFAPKIDYHLFVGNSWTAYNCFVWNGTGRNIQLCI